MHTLRNARTLANYILKLQHFTINDQIFTGYNHMGAVITDTVLQSGLNYRTVVEPRVKNILKYYPDANTTSSFYTTLNTHSVNEIIKWNHNEKINRILCLTKFFLDSNIETEKNLRQWIVIPENCDLLLQIRGIGPKSIDYLKNLIGIPAVAVDRHVRTFVNEAGIAHKNYHEIREIVAYAADLLQVSRGALDKSIWNYIAKTKYALSHL